MALAAERGYYIGAVNLTGRRVIVTGANAGLGLITVREFAAAGASVVLAARNPEKLADAVRQVRADLPEADLSVGVLDLADLTSVCRFAAEQRELGALDVLINNAGLMLVPEREFTADGFEMHMGVNHLGHFALTRELYPALAERSGRVVSLSSMAHRMTGPLDPGMGEIGPYGPFDNYAQSKLACVMFALELNRRIKRAGGGVTAVAAHPGYVATTLFTRYQQPSLSDRLSWIFTPIVGSRPSHGARSQLRAATDPALVGGEFIGPRFVIRGKPHLAAPAPAALDHDAAAMLWEISAEKTGGDFVFDPAD